MPTPSGYGMQSYFSALMITMGTSEVMDQYEEPHETMQVMIFQFLAQAPFFKRRDCINRPAFNKFPGLICFSGIQPLLHIARI